MKPINEKNPLTGLVLPLLSLRGESGPCGEFPDIAALARLARHWNMNIVQLLPLNDSGWQTSPYSALSAFALNPVYLRISDLPELGGCETAAPDAGAAEASAASAAHAARDAAELSARFGNERQVPYAAILEAKLEILGNLWKALRSSKSGASMLAEVEAWAAANPWVKAYSCFVELKAKFGGKPWWEWPDHGAVDDAAVEALWNDPELAEGARFRAWAQMRAEEQFAAACAEARALGVDLMGDIPILLNADSADVWHLRRFFDTERAAGAPPDMYSRYGQNWGFPLYRWDELERAGYSFWKDRLTVADRFYTMYRIDHVLGFFRIWAIGKREADGFLGHFQPEFAISYPELAALGFDAGRIRWLSKPHVPGGDAASAMSDLPEGNRAELAAALFERIGGEDLYLFSRAVEGGADIAETVRKRAGGGAGASRCVDDLLAWWRNRAFLEIAPGQFIPTWEYRSTVAWRSLSDLERGALEALIARKKGESLDLWEKTGRKILKALTACVPMQACAEDLGAVPPCVPEVLGELGIPGLRVLRWFRDWGGEGQPYVRLSEYPEDTVACMSVHDSTNLRQWWSEEADRARLWPMLRGELAAREALLAPHAGHRAAAAAEPPADLDPDGALLLLRAFACARSRCVVYPLQDLLAASARHREEDWAAERINVPGTTAPSNWLYRMKPAIGRLLEDETLAARLSSIAALRDVRGPDAFRG
jgi:4-alpha-glucanotransferase